MHTAATAAERSAPPTDPARRTTSSRSAASPPQAVQWLATAACDLSCPHCRSDAGARAPLELTAAEVSTLLLDELVLLGRPTLVVSGGEPFLRRDLGEVVRAAVARGLRWSVHTHGLHVARFRDLLEAHPPGLAAVSVDGPEPVHDRFRRRGGSYAAALQAVRSFKSWGVAEVVIGTTVTHENADLIVDMFPVVEASGADSWGLHLLTPEGRAGQSGLSLPSPAQLRRIAAFVRRRRATFPIELCNEWGGAGASDPFYRDAPFRCGAGRVSCVVTAAGEVLPCMTTDLRESEGNVRSRRLSEIWEHGFARFRRPEGDGLACWLQARHGRDPRGAAFGADPAGMPTERRPRPRSLEIVP